MLVYPELYFCSWYAVHLQLSSTSIGFSSVSLCLGEPFLPFYSEVNFCCTALSSTRRRCSRPLGRKRRCLLSEQHTALLNLALWSYKLKSGVEGSVVIWPLSPRGPALVFGRGGWCWAGRGWGCWDKAG